MADDLNSILDSALDEFDATYQVNTSAAATTTTSSTLPSTTSISSPSNAAPAASAAQSNIDQLLANGLMNTNAGGTAASGANPTLDDLFTNPTHLRQFQSFLNSMTSSPEGMEIMRQINKENGGTGNVEEEAKMIQEMMETLLKPHDPTATPAAAPAPAASSSRNAASSTAASTPAVHAVQSAASSSSVASSSTSSTSSSSSQPTMDEAIRMLSEGAKAMPNDAV